MGILKEVRKLDLFGPRVQLRFHNKKEYKTAFGGCFTILLLIGTILLAMSYIQEMISRQNPTVLQREELWQKGQIHSVNEDIFSQGIGIYEMRSRTYITNAQLTINIILDNYYTDATNNNAHYSYTLVQCDNTNQIFTDLYSSKGQNIYQYYCLSDSDFEEALKVRLDFESQIELEVRVPTRGSDDQYEVKLIQKDYFIDSRNYTNGLQPYWKQTNIRLDMSSHINISLDLNQIITDTAYFFTSPITHSSLILSNLDISQTFNHLLSQAQSPGTQDSILAVFSFTINRKIQTHTRSYIKLFDVIAITGGFIKSLMVCFRFLTKPFTKMALYVAFLNELFSFSEQDEEGSTRKYESVTVSKEDQEKQQKENILINKIINQEIQNESSVTNNGKESKKLKEEGERIFRKLMRIGQNTLSMSIVDFIKYNFNCFCKIQKQNLIKESKQRVNERLDIVYILKKLVEIDKLKMILLNEQQRRVFDYLPKPLVKVQPDGRSTIRTLSLYKSKANNLNMRTEWSLLHSELSTLQKAILAVKSFQNIMKTDSVPLSLIDLKLIEMLDPEIVSKFCAIKLDSFTDIGMHLFQDENSKKTSPNQCQQSSQSIDNKKIKDQIDVLNNPKLLPDQDNNASFNIESLRLQKIEEVNDIEILNHPLSAPISQKRGFQHIKKDSSNEQNFNKVSTFKMAQSNITVLKNKFQKPPFAQESIIQQQNEYVSPRELNQMEINQREVNSVWLNQDKVKFVSLYLNQRKQINQLGQEYESQFYEQQLLQQSQNIQQYPSLLIQHIIENSRQLNMLASMTSTRQQQKNKNIDSRKDYIKEKMQNECTKDKYPELKVLNSNDFSELSIIQSIEHNNLEENNQNIPSFNNTSQFTTINNEDNFMNTKNIALERSFINRLNPSSIDKQLYNNQFILQFQNRQAKI